MKTRITQTTFILPLVVLLFSGCASMLHVPITHTEVKSDEIGKKFSPEDLRSDLNFLFKTLEDVHPNLYAYTSKSDIDSLRQHLERELATPMARIEFYSKVAPIVARLGDGHTYVTPPWEEFAYYRSEGGPVFPLKIAHDTIPVFTIARNYSSDSVLSMGDQIVSINGLCIDSLGTVFLQGFSGERTSFRQQLVARFLQMLLWFHHIDSPYDLVVRQHHSQDRIARRVVGVADKDILRTDSLLAKRSVAPRPFRFERLEDSIMYIDFRSMEKPIEFKEFLLNTFADIQAKPIKGLIIDLRNNGGGNSELGITLLSFLTDSAYRMAERKEWRMSAQYKSLLRKFIPWWIRWFPFTWVSSDAKKYFGAQDGEIIVDTFAVERPDTNALRYRGKICFLIGPRTFSSAMMLADAVADFNLATLIGEETGGIPTAYGEVYPFDLPNTKLFTSVSSAFFVRANGNREDRGGVMPDIEVRQTEEDTRTGKDTALERARQWVLDGE